MNRGTLRKLVLDLTPLIDMIIILMFGVMIHSVELSKTAQSEAEVAKEHSEADRQALMHAGEDAKYYDDLRKQFAERLTEAQDRLRLSDEERRVLQRRLDEERRNVAEALAKLFDGLDQEKLKKLLSEQDLSQSGARRILEALKEAEKNDPATAYKAVRRIEEMQKVFTFIDLHLDHNDVLHLAMNGRKLDQIAVRDFSIDQAENNLRNRLQAPDFNQIVLFMFTNEGEARFKTVRTVEQGIKNLREHYEARFATKQFRYAGVGTVLHAPPTIDKPK